MVLGLFVDGEQLSAGALLFASWVNIVLYSTELSLCLYLLMGWPGSTSESIQELGLMLGMNSRQTLVTGTLSGFRTSPVERPRASTPGDAPPPGRRLGSSRRWFIAAVLLVDTICTMSICVNTYFSILSLEPTLANSNSKSHYDYQWPNALLIFTTCIAMSLEQGYFLRRYWKISKQKAITFILGLLILLDAVFILVNMVFIAAGNLDIVGKIEAPFVSALVNTVIDVSLAFALAWKLRSIPALRMPIRQLIHKISVYVFVYGIITAVSSLLLLGMWLVNINGYIFVLYSLGRVYSLTLLCNFLLASGWRAEAADFANNNRSTGDDSKTNEHAGGDLFHEMDFARIRTIISQPSGTSILNPNATASTTTRLFTGNPTSLISSHSQLNLDPTYRFSSAPSFSMESI